MKHRAIALASSALIAFGAGMLAIAQAEDEASSEIKAETGTAAGTKPSAVERAGAEVANELDQLASPDAPLADTELRAGLTLDKVGKPAEALAAAAVKNKKGENLGEVSAVVLGADGETDAISVEVGGFLGIGERVVLIDAESFVYLKDRNILVTSLSNEEVKTLPAVTPKVAEPPKAE